jgi:hypothetical protein
MRPMAIVAIGELVLLAVVVLAYLRMRHNLSYRIDSAVKIAATRAQAELERERRRFDEDRRFLKDELAKALDRVQAPQYAVEDSIASRVQRTPRPRVHEPSLGEQEQARERELAMRGLTEEQRAIEQELQRKLEERGIDPSELSQEAGPSLGGR